MKYSYLLCLQPVGHYGLLMITSINLLNSQNIYAVYINKFITSTYITLITCYYFQINLLYYFCRLINRCPVFSHFKYGSSLKYCCIKTIQFYFYYFFLGFHYSSFGTLIVSLYQFIRPIIYVTKDKPLIFLFITPITR